MEVKFKQEKENKISRAYFINIHYKENVNICEYYFHADIHVKVKHSYPIQFLRFNYIIFFEKMIVIKKWIMNILELKSLEILVQLFHSNFQFQFQFDLPIRSARTSVEWWQCYCHLYRCLIYHRVDWGCSILHLLEEEPWWICLN